MGARFVTRFSGEPARIAAQNGLFAVVTTTGGTAALKAFWQHTGLIVPSRQAEAWLDSREPLPETEALRLSLRKQLAGFYGVSFEDIFLVPTGMAAQFLALRILNRLRPNLPTVQLGFPYVDTFKVQEKLGHGAVMLHDLDHIDEELETLLARQAMGGCFCEIPGNPLLGSANVAKITPILRKHKVPLVVDDVVATPFNINLIGHADLIATSLTKFIAGTCDVMGGALVCSPASPYYAQLKAAAMELHEELLWGEDALILDTQARGFEARMRTHNANGLFIAERLRGHPAIEKVWYPKWEFSDAYESVRRPSGGWGALVTFLPKNAEKRSAQIFDAMAIDKGPSLGTVFSLACPFTLLAHYTELDWAESRGVSRYLIRLSVGLENPEELWQRIDGALSQ
jgi:cystathionine gamma-synthase